MSILLFFFRKSLSAAGMQNLSNSFNSFKYLILAISTIGFLLAKILTQTFVAEHKQAQRCMHTSLLHPYTPTTPPVACTKHWQS